MAGFQYGVVDILHSSLVVSTVQQKAKLCIDLSSYNIDREFEFY